MVIRGGTPARLPLLCDRRIGRTTRVSSAPRRAFTSEIKPSQTTRLGGGAHLIASYGEGFRSPQARELTEGEKVPFATVRGVEGGLKWKRDNNLQTSIVGFSSWLSHDRVFDATARENLSAPPSVRVGGAAALTFKAGPFGTSTSATYTRAWFTGGDARFADGDLVPYAPALVVRNDAYLAKSLGRLGGRHVMGRVGLGFEGIAGRPLPGGRDGKDFVYVDALAAIGWKAFELGVNATNLLGLKYYDSQYVYATNQGAPAPNVLVSPPQTVFLTLQVHLRGTPEYPRRQTPELRQACLDKTQNTAEEEECFR